MIFSFILALCLVSGTVGFNWQTSMGSTHYLKRLTPGIFTTGRLTTRQLGYVSEAGFASILAISEYSSDDYSFNGIEGKWPSTEQEKKVLDKYGTVFQSMQADMTAASYEQFFTMILSIPKPVLVQSKDSWLATLFVEIYMTQVGASDLHDIFNNSMTVGWDFHSDQSAVDLINAVTGLGAEVVPASIDLSLTDGENSYAAYYWPHRLGSDNWYTLGQTLDTQVNAIQKAGYKTVISFRVNGEGTNRLSWEPQSGPVENGEFSDSEGLYNVTAEEAAVTAAGMAFYNLPVGGDLAFTKEQFDSFIPAFKEADAKGPVLVHCASGYRSSVYTLAYMAMAAPEERCIDWAIKEARRVGESVDLSEADINKAVAFWRTTLAC